MINTAEITIAGKIIATRDIPGKDDKSGGVSFTVSVISTKKNPDETYRPSQLFNVAIWGNFGQYIRKSVNEDSVQYLTASGVLGLPYIYEKDGELKATQQLEQVYSAFICEAPNTEQEKSSSKSNTKTKAKSKTKTTDFDVDEFAVD